MRVFNARGTNDLAYQVYPALIKGGVLGKSRNGNVLMFPEPVTLTRTHPWEYVNFCPVRDANPVFHLMEALAILGDFNDVTWLSQFNSNIENYSDDGIRFNAFYGTRMRETWGDQLNAVIELLKREPDTRQAVIQLWDPGDLTLDTKDKACNMSMVFSISTYDKSVNLTVFNRSNDAIWGTVTGSNEVQFGMLLEYVAGSLNLPIGIYTHVTNNLHIYLDNPQWNKVREQYCSGYILSEAEDSYPEGMSMFNETAFLAREMFDKDLKMFFGASNRLHALIEDCHVGNFETDYFRHLVIPIYNAWVSKKYHGNSYLLPNATDAWTIAVNNWLKRRGVK